MNDPENSSSGPGPARPISVWFVSGWYLMSAVFSIGMIGLVQARYASTPPGPGQPLPLQTSDLLLAALLIALNMCGALFLFLLKKQAFLFFSAALALNVGTNVWYLLRRGAGGEPALILLGVTLGWLVGALVCRYAAGLVKTGVLK